MQNMLRCHSFTEKPGQGDVFSYFPSIPSVFLPGALVQYFLPVTAIHVRTEARAMTFGLTMFAIAQVGTAVATVPQVR